MTDRRTELHDGPETTEGHPSEPRSASRHAMEQLLRDRLATRRAGKDAPATSPADTPSTGETPEASRSEDLQAVAGELLNLHQTAAHTVELLLAATDEISRRADSKSEGDSSQSLLVEMRAMSARLDMLAKSASATRPDAFLAPLASRLRHGLQAAVWFSMGALAAGLTAGYYGWNNDRFMRTLNANQHRLYATFKEVCGQPTSGAASTPPSRRRWSPPTPRAP